MTLTLLLSTGIHLFVVRLFTFLFNHMVNIPLSLFMGLGKYFAFTIAAIMDVFQLVVFYNVLNNTPLGRKFGWTVDDKLFRNYKRPAFMSRLHNSWVYLGVTALSLLPIYLGGLFAAVFTAHLLKLNKTKSYVCIGLGSFLGCFIWTVGIWSLVECLIMTARKCSFS